MGFVENVSRHKLGVRWVMAAILGPGILLQRGTFAIALASVAYFLVEGHRIRSVSRRRGTSIPEMVSSSGLLLRRGFLWMLIGLAVLYNVMIAASFVLAFVTGVLLYVAGLFAQSVGERGRAEEDLRPSRTGPAGE